MINLKNFKELSPNRIVEELISYISNELPNFTTSWEFKNILSKKKNENQHSTAFCVFMTNKCSSKFCFQRENAQRGPSVIDIGVYFGSNLIFTIEAKLLPTPKGTKKNPRNEHEYVYGNGAGIERFKKEKHGYDNNDTPLSENAMIGYIKERDSNFWLKKVNQWIIDAQWKKSEQLKPIPLATSIVFKSKHNRINGLEFILYHFWLEVT